MDETRKELEKWYVNELYILKDQRDFDYKLKQEGKSPIYSPDYLHGKGTILAMLSGKFGF